MPRPKNVLERLLETTVPVEFRTGDPECVRQARLVFFFALVICVAALSYLSLYALLLMPFAALGAGFAAAFAPASLLVLRKTKSVALAGHTLSAVCVIALDLVTYGTGGIHSQALAWFILAPVIAAMIVSRYAAIAWLPIVAFMFATFWVIDGRGVVPTSEVPAFFDRAYKFAVPSGLMLAFFAIAWSYERARDQAIEALAKTHEALATARDAAQRAHGEARLVLDNVAQGMAIVRADGGLEGGASAVISDWFSAPREGMKLWELVGDQAPREAAWLEASWEDLQSDWLPLEMAIDQLPARLEFAGRIVGLDYRPVSDGQVLVVMTDITAQVEAQRIDAAQQELMAVFTRVLRDPKSVEDFLSEATSLVRRVTAASGSMKQEYRWIHTLKGNASLFGLTGFSAWLHELESALAERGDGLTTRERDELEARWSELFARVGPLLQDRREDIVAVDPDEFEATVSDAERGVDGVVLARRMRRWTWDRVGARLELLAERGEALAQRLGKPDVRVQVDCAPLMHPPSPAWSAFWNATVHVLRNALDHGIESPEQRAELGKKGPGEVVLWAAETDGRMVFEVRDDGAGIDWDAMRRRATQLGLPSETSRDLEAALFADGVTTRSTVTETSGRGVGMGALKETCEALGGRLELDSVPGRGTTVRCSFPLEASPTSSSPADRAA